MSKITKIDLKSCLDVKSRLNRLQARKILAEFFNKNPNSVSFSSHACKQMQARNLKSGDVLNVLRAGNIYKEPELENGSWRYRIETKKIAVVFAFIHPDRIRIVTVWREE